MLDRNTIKKLFKYTTQGAVIYLLFRCVPENKPSASDALIMTLVLTLCCVLAENLGLIREKFTDVVGFSSFGSNVKCNCGDDDNELQNTSGNQYKNTCGKQIEDEDLVEHMEGKHPEGGPPEGSPPEGSPPDNDLPSDGTDPSDDEDICYSICSESSDIEKCKPICIEAVEECEGSEEGCIRGYIAAKAKEGRRKTDSNTSDEICNTICEQSDDKNCKSLCQTVAGKCPSGEDKDSCIYENMMLQTSKPPETLEPFANVDEIKEQRAEDLKDTTAAASFTNDVAYSDYGLIPVPTDYESKAYEYGYSFLPPEKWYPQAPRAPICKATSPCPVCPIYTTGSPTDVKEWNSSTKILPPDNINIQYIEDKLNKIEAKLDGKA